MRRRDFLRSAGALAASSIAAPAIGQSARAQTLRYAPQVNLTFLDPTATLAAVTSEHGYCVFDTLVARDSKLKVRPQMAEGFTLSDDGKVYDFKLREGLRFHDGEPVRARDCVASLRRWMAKDTTGKLIASQLDAMEVVDDRAFRLRLKAPFPYLLRGLSKGGAMAAFMMPERLASSDLAKPITEMVGSGPYRFVEREYAPGHQIVYEKFAGYVPRNEPMDWLAGGKAAYFPRVEWRILPDPATAVAALRAGEVDWLQVVQPDLVQTLQRDSNVEIIRREPAGWIRMLRFNHLIPPFDNVKMRQAVMLAVDQRDYVAQATGGNDAMGQVCHAFYSCALPYGKPPTPDPLANAPDLKRARALVKEAGYKGEKVVVLNPSDLLGQMGQITKSVLESIGINVELLDLDWGALLQRSANRGPVASGGWNIRHTMWTGFSIENPIENAAIRGQGANGWSGWYESARMEELVDRWGKATTEAEQAAIAAETQELAFQDVPTVFTGLSFEVSAFRKRLRGIQTAPAAMMWSARDA